MEDVALVTLGCHHSIGDGRERRKEDNEPDVVPEREIQDMDPLPVVSAVSWNSQLDRAPLQIHLRPLDAAADAGAPVLIGHDTGYCPIYYASCLPIHGGRRARGTMVDGTVSVVGGCRDLDQNT